MKKETIFLILSIICFYVSQSANALCDVIRFTGQGEQYNQLFHISKWVFDRPNLVLFGFFSYSILKEQFKYGDIWHYKRNFLIWIVFVVNCIMIWWQLSYYCFGKIFN